MGFRASEDPRFETGIPDFMNGILHFSIHFNVVHRKVDWRNPKMKSLNSMPDKYVYVLALFQVHLVSGTPCFRYTLFQVHLVSGTPCFRYTLCLVACITIQKRSDYSPRGANSYKAGNDDVFSLFHAETD